MLCMYEVYIYACWDLTNMYIGWNPFCLASMTCSGSGSAASAVRPFTIGTRIHIYTYRCI